MAQYGWSVCPPEIRIQIEAVIATLSSIFSDTLTGIYLHGSLAMDCFNPARSDLDLLVVTQRKMTLDEKRGLAVDVLRISRSPRPLEMSIVTEAQLTPWHYPTPFDFHFSEDWRHKFSDELAKDTWQLWNDAEQCDSDLAAHITITKARGVTLIGSPIEEVFPSVPSAHYQDSILRDWDWIHDHVTDNPVYAILNTCRVYAYVRDRLITSKQEGGEWALNILPKPQRILVELALKMYRSDLTTTFDAETLQQFASEMDIRIGALRS